MAPEGDRPEDHDALVAAVRDSDILLFNSWYMKDGAEKIKKNVWRSESETDSRPLKRRGDETAFPVFDSSGD